MKFKNKILTVKILKEGFERVAHDADVLELAECGMDDYQQLINNT